MKASAPTSASSRVRASVSTANSFLISFRSSRPLWITPTESTMRRFSGLMPSSMKNLAEAMPAAPAPANTTFTREMSRPVSSRALRNAAPPMMAVPCWSSWNTGMSSRSRRVCSISKHSGALMSSRLMPPTVGASISQNLITSSGSVASISRSKTSMSAKRLNNTLLPSITGLPASGPMLPSPSTAVPLDTTATRLPRLVNRKAASGSSAMTKQGSATPGV